MKLAVAALVLLGSASLANAQPIDVFNNVGPSGTHILHELPISSYQYHATITCNWSFRYRFRCFKNTTLKIDELYDIINPQGTTEYYRLVDFTGWNLVVGDKITYYSYAVIINGPYLNQFDKDYLYGDVVNYYSRGSSRGEDARGSLLAAAIVDEKARYEALFA